MRLLVLAATLLLASPALAATTLPNKVLIAGAIDQFIRPGFQQLAKDAATLKKGVAALCAAPEAETLAVAREEFKAAVLAFSRVEFVQMGPLGVDDRLERLLFWPDVRGIGLRQVQAALASEDPTARDAATLSKKSVAMQGLGALEYLLFGTGADALAGTGSSYRCGYAGAITVLVDGIATGLDRQWADPAAGAASDAMLEPKPDATDYRTEMEVINKLAGTLIVGTEVIRDQRITPILGAASGGPKPKSALFWRSGMTVPALKANFAGLADFFAATRFAETLGMGNAWVANSIAFEFETAAKSAAAITDPLDVAVTNDAELKALKQMVFVTGSLDNLLGTNLAQALGLSVGFSQLDGD